MDFDLQKKQTLAKLGKPDRSRATNVDKHIVSLLDTINTNPNWYTTSSCSGRIMVLEESTLRIKKEVKWHFVSHDPVKEKEIMLAAKKGVKNTVWFKFEPLILHVCCRDTTSAQEFLVICQNTGLKHSGAITIGKRIILEIIGNDRIDCPVAQGRDILADDAYLSHLVKVANKKLSENLKRIERFEKEIKKLINELRLIDH
ncbi:MAG: tRNA wybutosine-synthesizing 3 family protein [Nanoarchaeota archaeon]